MKRKVCLSDPLNPPNEPDKYLYLCLNLNKQVCRASNGNRPTGEYYWKTDTVPVLQTYSGSVVWFKKNQNGFLYDPDTDMNEHDGFIKEVTDIENGISMATEWYLVHPTYTDYLDANYKIGNRYAIIGKDDYDITTAPSIQLLN